jgi:6-pyruvoyl-tetrahydropterin synthase
MAYSVSVKDRMMYSHTFTFDDGKPFTTGCTSVVTATLEGDALGPFDILIDIMVAQQLLREVMETFDHKNLDEMEMFRGRNTTVEVIMHRGCPH